MTATKINPEESLIEWTDYTANPWTGCAKVHTGCKNCYAEVTSNRHWKAPWGKNKPRHPFKNFFKNLDKWQRKHQKANEKKRVFVASIADIFEGSKPLYPTDWCDHATTGEIRQEFLNGLNEDRWPNLVFLLLTKRPGHIAEMVPYNWLGGDTPENLWFGTSVSDQKTADQYLPMLINAGKDLFWTKQRHRLFVSVEPQVDKIQEPLSLIWSWHDFQWIVQGGESGPNKRPFDIEWARTMRDEVQASGVPYFFKQIDKKQEIPTDLRIRELPEW